MQKNQSQNANLAALTPQTYKVPQEESNLFHVVLERVRYSQVDGKKTSSPYLQKFGAREFTSYMKRSLEAQGYTVTILHDPENPVKKAEGKPVDSAEPTPDKK